MRACAFAFAFAFASPAFDGDDRRARERRGRPRKPTRVGDAEGVRKALSDAKKVFPSIDVDGVEGRQPGRVEMRRESDARDGGDASDARRVAKGDEERRVRAAKARVGTRATSEARKKIAESQRARWARAREGDDGGGNVGVGDDAGVARGKGKAKRGKPGNSERNERLTKIIAMKKSTTRAEKLASSSVKVSQFSSELSRYKNLREDLASWSDGFARGKGRRPNFKDVQATRIPWLIESFQEYVKLRNKLIAETPNIRGEVGKMAKATLPSPRSLRASSVDFSGVFLSFDDVDDDDEDEDEDREDFIEADADEDEDARRGKNFSVWNFK